MKNAKNSIQVTYRRTLEIRRPTFKPSRNIRYLDATKLSKGSHTIELGKFEGSPCDCMVTAKIKDGMISDIVYPKCKEATPIPTKLAKEIQTARRKSRASGKWKEVSVVDFIRKPAVARMIIDIIVDGDCFMLCVTTNGHESCVICCADWCIGPSEPTLVGF